MVSGKKKNISKTNFTSFVKLAFEHVASRCANISMINRHPSEEVADEKSFYLLCFINPTPVL